MRRTIASVLCLLMLATVGGMTTASANVGGELSRGAGAYWWRHGATHGTLYFFDVYESIGTYGNQPQVDRGFFGSMPCDVGRRNRPVDCKWRQTSFQRIKVDSFDIDPLMNSAHVIVHDGDRRGELTWTGRGDYHEPFLWQSAGDFLAPPYLMHAYAHVIAYTGRNAKVTGDLFGLDLKRGEVMGAGMANVVSGGVSTCFNGPWCW